MENQELEVKMLVSNLEAIRDKLVRMNASLHQPRTREMNLRFDTPFGKLSKEGKALRLRSDTASRMTYKGPSESKDGVRVREEIEFKVSDFNAARAFLNALGFQLAMVYEKYRTEYDIEGTSISLDEMPYGDFIEIEGKDTQQIRNLSDQLGLNWESRISDSYMILFNRLKAELGLEFRDLIFENFENLNLNLDVLGIHAADEMPG